MPELAVPDPASAAESLLERVHFAVREEPGEWPDWSEAGLSAALPELLAFLPGRVRLPISGGRTCGGCWHRS